MMRMFVPRFASVSLVLPVLCLFLLTSCRHIHPVANPSSAGPDSPPPSPLTLSTQYERIVIVRLTFDTDLLDGLKKAVARENIKNAVITNGIGSLRSYHVHAVSNTTFPSTNIFYKGEGPYDLTSVEGYVLNGKVHAHINFSNEKIALGGHLEPDTRVFTFCIVTLGVLPDSLDLRRFDDGRWR